MAGKLRTFTVEPDDTGAVDDFVEQLRSQGAVNINVQSTSQESTQTLLVTVTWDDSTGFPYTDAEVENEDVEVGTYMLVGLEAEAAEYNETDNKYVVTLKPQRVTAPDVTVEGVLSDAEPVYVVEDIQKNGKYGVKATKKRIPSFLKTVSSDSTLTGDGTAASPLSVVSGGLVISSIAHKKEDSSDMSGTPPNGGDYAGRYVKYVSFVSGVLTFHYDLLRYGT